MTSVCVIDLVSYSQLGDRVSGWGSSSSTDHTERPHGQQTVAVLAIGPSAPAGVLALLQNKLLPSKGLTLIRHPPVHQNTSVRGEARRKRKEESEKRQREKDRKKTERERERER